MSGPRLLRFLQEDQAEWSRQNFGDQPAINALLGVQEEVGELSHHHLKEAQGIRTNEDHVAGAQDAVGDIVIYLMDYCSRRGWDFEEIVFETWEGVVKKRDWVENPEEGVAV